MARSTSALLRMRKQLLSLCPFRTSGNIPTWKGMKRKDILGRLERHLEPSSPRVSITGLKGIRQLLIKHSHRARSMRSRRSIRTQITRIRRGRRGLVFSLSAEKDWPSTVRECRTMPGDIAAMGTTRIGAEKGPEVITARARG